MKIAATARPTLLHPSQRTLLSPTDAPTIPPGQAKDLIKAAGAVVGKNVTGTSVAAGAWKLTTVPQTTTHDQLASFLANNNISPDKAPGFAKDLRELLANPAVRAVLFGVSGSAAAYLIVEKTSWSRRVKWLTVIGAGVITSGLYLVLRHYGIMK